MSTSLNVNDELLMGLSHLNGQQVVGKNKVRNYWDVLHIWVGPGEEDWAWRRDFFWSTHNTLKNREWTLDSHHRGESQSHQIFSASGNHSKDCTPCVVHCIVTTLRGPNSCIVCPLWGIRNWFLKLKHLNYQSNRMNKRNFLYDSSHMHPRVI